MHQTSAVECVRRHETCALMPVVEWGALKMNCKVCINVSVH
jgi:hypothetical protein